VDLDQLLDADLGVNLRRFELLVAEQLLDEADVRAAFEHVRGAAACRSSCGSGAGAADSFPGSAA